MTLLHSIRQTWGYAAGTVNRQADIDRMNVISRQEADLELVRLGQVPDSRHATAQKWAAIDLLRGVLPGSEQGASRAR